VEDVGDRQLPPQFQEILAKYFNYPKDNSSAIELKTFTGQYFLDSGRWFQFLLFLPICVLLGLGLRDKPRMLLILFLSLCIVGVAIFLIERPSVRFLHTGAWMFFLILGVGINRLINSLTNVFERDRTIIIFNLKYIKKNSNEHLSVVPFIVLDRQK
jgi:hypothetical protein